MSYASRNKFESTNGEEFNRVDVKGLHQKRHWWHLKKKHCTKSEELSTMAVETVKNSCMQFSIITSATTLKDPGLSSVSPSHRVGLCRDVVLKNLEPPWQEYDTSVCETIGQLLGTYCSYSCFTYVISNCWDIHSTILPIAILNLKHRQIIWAKETSVQLFIAGEGGRNPKPDNEFQLIHSQLAQRELTRVFADDEAPINKKLPKELHLRIFSYLDVVSLCRCAQVSRAWNVLALDGSNWQRIDLFDFQKDVEGPIIENISRRCVGFLRQLSLRGCQSIADGSMKTLAQMCPNIEDLNLNGCKKLTDSTCQALSRHCSKLQKLNLDSCASITDFSLKLLSDGCPQLTHINISWCSNITEDGVEALSRGCPKLRSFISKGCKQITSRAVICLARYCQQLEVVNLLGCSNIRDEAVQALAEKCSQLHYLCISGCLHLTDTSLVALAQQCPKLSTLEVAGCVQFTDTAFQALARSCRYLEKMDLDECVLITDATLTNLAIGCPRLEYLTLSHCELITDEGIRHLCLSPCAAENLTVLELDNCPLITDASLEYLTSCHNLQRVELYDCQLLTRVGIRRLRTHLPNIKVHAYFAPVTPPPAAGGSRQRYCRCCAIL